MYKRDGDIEAAPMSRRERKKQETRMRILNEAITLMAERGYNDVKIDDIARAADIANATFFLHFPTKAALLTAFNEQVSQMISERLEEFALGPVEQLEVMRAIILDEWGRHRELLLQIMADAAAQNGEGVVSASAELRDQAREIIAKGQGEGVFSPDFDAEVVGDCLIAAWRMAMLEAAGPGGFERATQVSRQSLDLLLTGLINRA